MRAPGFILVWVFAGATGHAGTRFVLVQPGGPGSTRQAAAFVKTLARHLERGASLRLNGQYHNQIVSARAYIEKERPAFGFVSLDFYLAFGSRYRMVPILSTRLASSTTMHFEILVPGSSRLAGPGALAGKRLSSNGQADPRFLHRVLGVPGGVRPVPERRTLRAVKATLEGRADAVLIDGDLALLLARTPYGGRLRRLWRSVELPRPLVVLIGGGMDASRTGLLVRRLKEMHVDPKGKRILGEMRIDGFGPVAIQALRRAEGAYRVRRSGV